MGSASPLRGLHVLVLLLLMAAPLKPAPSPYCTYLNECCVPETRIRVKENNTPGFIVSNITVNTPPVTVAEEQGTTGILSVVGDTLQLSISLDYETMKDPVIICSLVCGPDKNSIQLFIEVRNVNDKPPAFPDKELKFNISELYPVGQPWITVLATDIDQDVIYYSLDKNTDGAHFFRLKTENTPELYLTKALDYRRERSLTLLLNAKEASNSNNVSDTVTITIDILDADNLPPVFQPCSELPGSGVCLNAVYRGRITQYQIESRPLSLQPQDILAVDGDTGINATIVYQIVNDHHKAFRINASDGTLTMSKAVNYSDSIVLTVLAAQENDRYKYSITSVTLSVVPVSRYPPQFSKSVYEGSIQGDSLPGSIVLQAGSSTKPLAVQAQDPDYPNLISPVLSYTLTSPDIFTISRDGLIFTRTHLLPVQSHYRLNVTATDEVNGEAASTWVKVLVTGTDAQSTVTTTQGSAPTNPPGTVPGTAPGTGGLMSTLAPPAPTSVRPTTSGGTAPPGPVTHSDGTRPPLTGASTPSRDTPGLPGSTAGQSPGPTPTPTTPPVKDTATPGLGPSEAGTPPSNGSGPGVTTPTSVRPTTSGGTAPPGPVTHSDGTRPPLTGASTPSRDTPGLPGSTAGQSPGPTPTPTTPPVKDTATPGLGPSEAGTPPSNGSGPGVTSVPSSQLLKYDAEHMAAVGVPLSVLLLVCLGIICVLLQRGGCQTLRLGSTAKLKAFSRRPHSAGSEPVQFTNRGFLLEGTGKLPPTSTEPAQESVPVVSATALASALEPGVGSTVKSAASPGGSPGGSPVDEATADGGVKSILTKERKSGEGYKAVWFKEDIKPETDEEGVTEEEEGGEGGTDGGDGLSSNL